MRLLVTIPHYFNPVGISQTGRFHGSLAKNPQPRIDALSACIYALHQLFGQAQYMMQIVHGRTALANRELTAEVHVVVCTVGDQHLLRQLKVDPLLYHHHPTQADPLLLGYECQSVLRDRWGNYDYYCYLEDDLILHDPWLLVKLAWFNKQAGDDKLLLPNRFERGTRPLVTKAYVDGDLSEELTSRFQDIDDTPVFNGHVLGAPVRFWRPLNPHSGCYFLNKDQMAHWIRQPYFLDRSGAFVGPLESAATLGVMRAFKIFKPAAANASFLEIEHFGNAFLSQLRSPDALPKAATAVGRTSSSTQSLQWPADQ